MKRLALIALLALTAGAHAGLIVSNTNVAPSSAGSGSNLTVVIEVTNSGAASALGVSTSAQPVGSASATLVAAPTPGQQNIAASASGSFTWVFQSSGCGLVGFSVWAGGTDSSNSSTITASGNSGQSLVNCTPSPTPSATPVVTATMTPTATPWIVYGTPTAVPSDGDARIPGNLYHPDRGLLQLQFDAPAEGKIEIDLYNRLGQHVKHFERSVQPGSYTELWDGRGDQGLLVAAGIYVAQFKGKGLFKTVKFAVIK